MGNNSNDLGDYSFYLTNINKLIDDVNIRLLEYDFEFFTGLCGVFDLFKTDNIGKELMKKYFIALKDSININEISPLFDNKDVNGDDLLTQLLKRLLFNYEYDLNGKIVSKRRLKTENNNKNLRIIINYIKNYDLIYEEKYGIPSSIHSKNKLGKFHNMHVIPGQTRMHI